MTTPISDILKDVASALRCSWAAPCLPSAPTGGPPWSSPTSPSNNSASSSPVGPTSLDGLDLAALLRVFNYNFDDISQRDNLPRDVRTWLKEMQGIRNKYAHPSGEALPVDDQWRDLDTIQRFSAAIGAQKDLLDTIANLKASLIQSAAPVPAPAPPPVAVTSTEFAPGDEVALKSDPSKVGYVVQVIPSTPENRYAVIIDGKKLTCYASQLERKAQPAATRNLAHP